MKISLYINTDDKNKLSKTLSDSKNINININKSFDFNTPIIRIKYFDGIEQYNYVEFNNRYYFITNRKFIANNQIELYLKCDLLMTYKEELLTCKGTVTLSVLDNNYSNKINPTYDTRLKLKKYTFPNSFTDTPINVLVVANNRSEAENE